MKKINLKKWIEETICPCCSGSDFCDVDDFHSNEIFRDFTCNSCNTKWTERYNLTKITSGDLDLEITSELEDKLLKENELLQKFIKIQGYSDIQLKMICNSEKVYLEPKCLSLKADDCNFASEKYSKNDILEAIFLIDNDLVKVVVSSDNSIFVNIESETNNERTLEFANEVKDFDVRKYLIDRYLEEKYPFLYDGEIDNDILKEWAKENMNYGIDFCLFINNQYVKFEKMNGKIRYSSFDTILDYKLDASPLNVTILDIKAYHLFWVDPSYIEGPNNHSSNFCEVLTWPKEEMSLKCYSKLVYEDYEHCQDEGTFGLEIGYFDIEGTCLESIENIWFETESKRDYYIKRNNLVIDVSKISEYSKDEKIFTNLENYPNDTIFNIKTSTNSEAEVTKDELWQLVETPFGEFFVNIDNENINMSPVQKGGYISPYYKEEYIIYPCEKNILLQTLVVLKHLNDNYLDTFFHYKGNEDIQNFEARIDSFRLDSDNSIIVVLVDQEDMYFDVSLDEIIDNLKEL